jgi:MOSC domain-containing protein YiiM
VKIRHIYISAGHNFFGHGDHSPGAHPVLEVPEIECVAGRGLRGDRFFDFKPDYKGQITFFAAETHAALSRELGIPDQPPSVYRRNVITEGVDLNTLIGREFEVQGIRFRGTAHCSPCHWMNEVVAPGAETWLRNCGGLRAMILTDGTLRAEPPAVTIPPKAA